MGFVVHRHPWPGAVLALAIGLRGVAAAQAPVVTPDPDPSHLGRYIVTIVTPPVLDYAGTTTLDAGGNVTTNVTTHSPRGRIKGTSVTSGPAINTEGALRGRVSTRQGLPFVQLRMVERGDINGDKITSVIRSTARLEGWGADSVLVGQLRARYCSVIFDPIREVKKRICATNTPPLMQPAPHVGTWEVRLALDASGGRVIGAGSIATGVAGTTGRTVDVAVSGSVSSSGPSTVKLSPMGDASLGGPVVLLGPLVPDADGQLYFAAVHEVKGRLLGQSFDEVFDSVP